MLNLNCASSEVTQGLRTGFPGGSIGKESACNAGDPGSIPGLECKSRIRLSNETTKNSGVGGRGQCLRILVRSRENLPVTLARGYPLGSCGPICNRAKQHVARRRAVWSVDGTRSMVAAGSVSASMTAPSRGGLSSSKSRGWSSPSAIALPVCIPRRENVTRPTCGSESLPPRAAAAAEAGERSVNPQTNCV